MGRLLDDQKGVEGILGRYGLYADGSPSFLVLCEVDGGVNKTVIEFLRLRVLCLSGWRT